MKKTHWKRAGTRLSLVLLSVFILLVLLASAASSQQAGDVNFDGNVDVYDVILVQKHILGYQPPLNSAQLTAADVNGDGIVNVVDVNLIMQYIQGYINSFPTYNLHAPTLISPAEGASVDGTMVSFQWGAVTGAARYQLEITKVSDGSIFRTVNLGNVTSISENTFANDGAQYRWRVRAGSATEWGAWSVRRTFTNGTAALPVLTLGFPANNASLDTESINFQWSAVAGASRYQLEVVRVSDGFIFKNIELGNITSASQSGFPNNGTEYRWRVRAGTVHTWGAWTAHRNFTSGVVLPAPVLSSPANKSTISGTSVLFRWNQVSGATKYQLHVFKGTENVPFKDVTVGNLAMSEQFGFQHDGATYSWRVRAGNNTGWGAWSGDFTFTGSGLVAAPVLVSPISKVPPVAGRQVNFSWQVVTGAINYELEIVNERTGAFLTKASLGNVTSSIQRGFDDDGTPFKWRVRAAGSEGWGAWSDFAHFVNGNTPGAPVLSRPEHNENIGRSWTNFEWQAVVGADRYELEIKDSNGQVFRTATVSGRTTSLQQDFPVDGGQYSWTVRSGNANGWSSVWTSPPRSFTVGSRFSFPTLILPVANADVRLTPAGAVYAVDFEWSEVGGAKQYNLQVVRAIDNSIFKNITKTTSPLLTQTETGFLNGEQYKWRVRAGEGTTWGTWSAYRNFIAYDTLPARLAPLLLSPAEGATATGTTVTFKWTPLALGVNYDLEIINVSNGSVFKTLTNVSSPAATVYEVPYSVDGFPDDSTQFMWRVRGSNGRWTLYRTFTNGLWWVLP